MAENRLDPEQISRGLDVSSTETNHPYWSLFSFLVFPVPVAHFFHCELLGEYRNFVFLCYMCSVNIAISFLTASRPVSPSAVQSTAFVQQHLLPFVRTDRHGTEQCLESYHGVLEPT